MQRGATCQWQWGLALGLGTAEGSLGLFRCSGVLLIIWQSELVIGAWQMQWGAAAAYS